jgi:hypothetical protein
MAELFAFLLLTFDLGGLLFLVRYDPLFHI